MGRAKRKQRPQAVAARRVDREAPPLDDRVVKAILEAGYGDGDTDGDSNPTIGIGLAVVAGTGLWTIIGVIVVLLF